MKLSEFRQFVKNLCDYNQRQYPSRESVDLWYEDVKQIPATELAAVFDVLKRGEYPRNMATAVLNVRADKARSAGNGRWQPAAEDCREKDRFDEARRRFGALPPEERRNLMVRVARDYGVQGHFTALEGLIRLGAIWRMARPAGGLRDDEGG